MASLQRANVDVRVEKVFGIVFGFQFSQPAIVRSVERLDDVARLVAVVGVIHVSSPTQAWRECFISGSAPRCAFLGVFWIAPLRDQDDVESAGPQGARGFGQAYTGRGAVEMFDDDL